MKQKKFLLEPHVIDDVKYYTVKQFALITHRSEVNVRHLIHDGNRIRKLRCTHIIGKPMIPAIELCEFPFTLAGRNIYEVYYYNKDGEIDSERDKDSVFNMGVEKT